MCALSSADRVPGYEPVGRGFESPQARQNKKPSHVTWFFCFGMKQSHEVRLDGA